MHKVAKTHVKFVVMATKTVAFDYLYIEPEDKRLYRLANARERVRDLDQVKCIKDKVVTILVEETHIKRRWQGHYVG